MLSTTKTVPTPLNQIPFVLFLNKEIKIAYKTSNVPVKKRIKSIGLAKKFARNLYSTTKTFSPAYAKPLIKRSITVTNTKNPTNKTASFTNCILVFFTISFFCYVI